MTEDTRKSPRVQAIEALLRQWGDTAVDMLEEMIRHIREGRLYDDTLRQDFDGLRHMIGRHDVLITDLQIQQGPHRGPGTAGYREIK